MSTATVYDQYVKLALTCATNASTIFFTWDGSDPVNSTTAVRYDGMLHITSIAIRQIRVRATREGWASSADVSGSFIIKDRVSHVLITPSVGEFTESVLVTMQNQLTSESNVPQQGYDWAAVYYTTDGSAPSVTNGIRYTKPIAWSRLGNTSFRAIGEGEHDGDFNPCTLSTHRHPTPPSLSQSCSCVCACCAQVYMTVC